METSVMTSDRQVAEPVVSEPLTLPASSLDTITRCELDVQIVTARRYPRSLALFKSTACSMVQLDPETAQACYYSLRRKKADGSATRIEGPTVRLAEIAATAWGNLRAGARVIRENDREVTALGYAHDLQTNYAIQTEVSRRIVDRHGSRYSDDMVIMTANAACAIARRNAVFAVIPRAYVNPLVEVARQVVAGKLKTLREGGAKLIAGFAELGVSAAQLCAKCDRTGVEDLDVQDLRELSELLTAIAEQETTVEEQFPPPARLVPDVPAASRTAALAETVRGRRSRNAGDEPPGGDAGTAPATPAAATPEPPATTPETTTGGTRHD